MDITGHDPTSDSGGQKMITERAHALTVTACFAITKVVLLASTSVQSLLSSSMAEHSAVNRRVVGSSPT